MIPFFFLSFFFITTCARELPDTRAAGVLEMLYDAVKSTAPICHERVWRAENIATLAHEPRIYVPGTTVRSMIFIVRITCFRVSSIAALYLDWISHISDVNLNEKKRERERGDLEAEALYIDAASRRSRSFIRSHKFTWKNVATYPAKKKDALNLKDLTFFLTFFVENFCKLNLHNSPF